MFMRFGMDSWPDASSSLAIPWLFTMRGGHQNCDESPSTSDPRLVCLGIVKKLLRSVHRRVVCAAVLNFIATKGRIDSALPNRVHLVVYTSELCFSTRRASVLMRSLRPLAQVAWEWCTARRIR